MRNRSKRDRQKANKGAAKQIAYQLIEKRRREEVKKRVEENKRRQ